MQITLSPQRRDTAMTLSRTGDTLTINGAVYDFSAVREGETLPQAAAACDWLASDVARIDGVLHLTLILPHGAHAPQETLFPAPLTLTSDGPVTLPAFDLPPEDEPLP